MRCIACFVVEGRRHLEGDSRARVGHQSNGLSIILCVTSYKSVGLSVFEWGKGVDLLRVRK